MKESDLKDCSKDRKKHFCTKYKFIIIILATLISFIVITVAWFISFWIASSHQIIISQQSEIYVAKGKSLRQLHFVKSHDSERYENRKGPILVLNENEEFDVISSQLMFNDKFHILDVPLRNEMFEFECKGTCSCYEEEIGYEEKRVSNLIFSSKYSRVVVVAVLGFAVSRFIGESIDECYDDVRRVLGYEEEGRSVTCLMEEDANCDHLAKDFSGRCEVEGDSQLFECHGYCITNNCVYYHTERTEKTRIVLGNIEPVYENFVCEDIYEFQDVWVEKREALKLLENIEDGKIDGEYFDEHFLMLSSTERSEGTERVYEYLARIKFLDMFLSVKCSGYQMQIEEYSRLVWKDACTPVESRRMDNIVCMRKDIL